MRGVGGGRREVLERLFATIAREESSEGKGCACLLQLGLLGWLHVARSDFPLRRRAGGDDWGMECSWSIIRSRYVLYRYSTDRVV